MQKSDMLKKYISVIVSDPALHAKWLNTFSFLEYIGFRKIVKSQGAESLSTEVLTHAVEEGRHALQLKRLALKIGGLKYNTYAAETLLCGKEAEEYFQSLDRHCAESLSGSTSDAIRLTYLYVTWLVEVRALEVYDIYQNTLIKNGVPPTLQGLLNEELGHLRIVEEALRKIDPEFNQRGHKLKEVEFTLYQNYLCALSKALPLPATEYVAAP